MLSLKSLFDKQIKELPVNPQLSLPYYPHMVFYGMTGEYLKIQSIPFNELATSGLVAIQGHEYCDINHIFPLLILKEDVKHQDIVLIE